MSRRSLYKHLKKTGYLKDTDQEAAEYYFLKRLKMPEGLYYKLSKQKRQLYSDLWKRQGCDQITMFL